MAFFGRPGVPVFYKFGRGLSLPHKLKAFIIPNYDSRFVGLEFMIQLFATGAI